VRDVPRGLRIEATSGGAMDQTYKLVGMYASGRFENCGRADRGFNPRDIAVRLRRPALRR
jgi:hypothetical protein